MNAKDYFEDEPQAEELFEIMESNSLIYIAFTSKT